MAQDRPSAAELLEAVREFLAGEVLPEMRGRDAFLTRVSINVLAMVERELALGAALEGAERSRLCTLLEREGELAELNRELARRIREGTLDDRRDAVLAHLRAAARDKLRIADPSYLDGSDAPPD